MQGWPPASEDDRPKGEDMGREKRLREYFRRLGAMYCKAPKTDSHPDLAEDQDKVSSLSAAEDEMHYEKLINGAIPARTGFEKAIQAHTRRDAGLVLAMIGKNHPASRTVYKYLVRQKRAEYRERLPHSYLLFRGSIT